MYSFIIYSSTASCDLEENSSQLDSVHSQAFYYRKGADKFVDLEQTSTKENRVHAAKISGWTPFYL